jgi:hypothetical protein
MPFDAPVARAMAELREGTGGVRLGGDVRRELEALQQFGQGTFSVLIALAIVLLDRRRSRRLVDWGLAAGVTALLLYPAKMLIGRPRPKFDDPFGFTGPFGASCGRSERCERSERLNAPDSKSGWPPGHRGFESPPLRFIETPLLGALCLQWFTSNGVSSLTPLPYFCPSFENAVGHHNALAGQPTDRRCARRWCSLYNLQLLSPDPPRMRPRLPVPSATRAARRQDQRGVDGTADAEAEGGVEGVAEGPPLAPPPAPAQRGDRDPAGLRAWRRPSWPSGTRRPR